MDLVCALEKMLKTDDSKKELSALPQASAKYGLEASSSSKEIR